MTNKQNEEIFTLIGAPSIRRISFKSRNSKVFISISDQKEDLVDIQNTSWLRKIKENISTPINKVQCIAYIYIYLYFNWFISHKTDLFFFSSNKVEYEKEWRDHRVKKLKQIISSFLLNFLLLV